MYSLLAKQPFRGTHISSRFIQAKFKFQESISQVQDYYNNNAMFLNNNHLLVRLVSGLFFDMEGSVETTYKVIDSRKDRICSGLGITTDVNHGKLFDKTFYTDNCAIVSCSFSNIFHLPHWKHIRAVRVLTHPHVSLRLNLPHVLKSVDKDDYSVVGIDVPLLAIQFQQWLLIEQQKPLIEREGVAHFVHRWVLPGMLNEQVDIAIRNRMCQKFMGVEREEPKYKIPFYVQHYDNEIDNALDDIVEYINTADRTLYEVMNIIPMVSNDTYYDSIPKELDGIGVYSYWIRLLTYIDWFYPLAIGTRIDPNQELVTKKLNVIKRYVISTGCDRFIESPIDEKWLEKWEAVYTMWT